MHEEDAVQRYATRKPEQAVRTLDILVDLGSLSLKERCDRLQDLPFGSRGIVEPESVYESGCTAFQVKGVSAWTDSVHEASESDTGRFDPLTVLMNCTSNNEWL